MKIVKYVFYDILRSKIIIAYAIFLLIASLSLFQMENNEGKAMLSILNIVLIVLPLVSLIFTTIHYYNSYEFIEMMTAQPISRRKILLSEYAGVSLSLLLAFYIGVGIPVLLFMFNSIGFVLISAGTCLTFIFTSIAFFTSVIMRDKARGIGFALLLWFYFTLLYDGFLLLIMFSFSDYPLEKTILGLTTLNPVDLARIFMMLKMDISALMGYSGAVYKTFFGSGLGIMITLIVMAIWIITPLFFALRKFNKKDL